ncbi:hypothetical protein K438DRAFT_1818947, partial [Mycena galopus ATCC 62051]
MCKKHCDLDGGCHVHLPPPPTVPRAAHRLAQDTLHNDHQHRAALARIPSATPSPPHLAPVKHDLVLVHWEHDNQPPTVYGPPNAAATGPYPPSFYSTNAPP